MLIRIHCPNPKCKKQLRIDARHAGKKISCVGCKQHIRLPTAEELKITVAAMPNATAPGEEQIVDFDALAAEAVIGDKAAVEVANKTEMIDFTCPQCDEPIQLAIENAGKRAPCPACRRIISVPKVDTGKPKDWREKEIQGPSMAKKEEVKLEGAWGNQAVARVSLEALEEARALPKVKRKLTTNDYVRYGVYAAIILGVLGTTWWGWNRYRSSALESNALASIREAVQDTKLPLEMHAVLHFGLGEWMLKTGSTPDTKKDGVAELKKAVSTTDDPLWTFALANDVADVIGPAILLDSTQSPGPIDLQFLVQLLANVPPGHPREEVLRTLCRSVLRQVQQQPEKIEMARTLLTLVIRQAMQPTNMTQPKDAAQPTASQDYSEQLNGLGILAQELIRAGARDSALQLIGRTSEKGERALYKKGMPVPKAFVAAMTALSQEPWEVNKEQEPEMELGKMIGHFLAGKDGRGDELLKKRQEGGFAEINLLPFLDIAQQSIDGGRMPEALTRLSQAMSIAQIYAQGGADSSKLRVYSHARLCELTAKAGEIALAEERLNKLKFDDSPLSGQLARAMVARQRSIQSGDSEALLAGLAPGSAGQAWAAYSLAKKQAEVTKAARTAVSGQLAEGPVKAAASLGGLIGAKPAQAPKEAK